jgi:hypothetical protein
MRIICFLLLIFSITVKCQNTKNTTQLWWDFNGSYTFNEKWKALTDAGYRISTGDETFHRLFARPSGTLKVTDILILQAGIGYFITFNDVNSLREIRPFQGLVVNWPKLGHIPLVHYVRFEQRFFKDSESSLLIYRGRYQLGTRILLNEDRSDEYFYIPVQLEWFTNWNSRFNFRANEFRAVAGAGFVFDKSLRLEFNTILQNSEVTFEEIYTFHDFILRFRIYKEFNTD